MTPLWECRGFFSLFVLAADSHDSLKVSGSGTCLHPSHDWPEKSRAAFVEVLKKGLINLAPEGR